MRPAASPSSPASWHPRVTSAPATAGASYLCDKAYAVGAAHGDGCQSAALCRLESILHLVQPPLGAENGAAGKRAGGEAGRQRVRGRALGARHKLQRRHPWRVPAAYMWRS